MSKTRSFVSEEDPGVLEAPEEVLSTMTRDGKRKWLYPVLSTGVFYRKRLWVGWGLILLFVLLPIIHVNGKPAVLLDFIHREFALFGLTFFPTDTFLLLFLAIAGLMGVILITSLLGRVWCGWACPQTVYLEFVYRPIERLIEGKEHVRKRRNEGPWTWDKVWRKSLKLGIYIFISLALAHIFVSYFVGWGNLLHWMTQSPGENWGFFVMMAFTAGLILFDFGYFREQMCTITCPYARMQSVIVDRDSLIVSYDPNRGEPRSKRSKKILRREEAGEVPAQGDCIDCFACVRTCPTGIDIRDGLQMECITCTQCIDACDSIMDNIGKPRGLIRYTSENELEGQKTHLLRPRPIIYTVLFVALISIFVIVLTTRGSFDINVGRSVGEPFTVLQDGRITNRLRFRVRNQKSEATSFTINAVQPAGAEVNIIGVSPVTLEPSEMKRVEAWVLIPADRFTGDSVEGVFELTFDDGTIEQVPFLLLGPSN